MDKFFVDTITFEKLRVATQTMVDFEVLRSSLELESYKDEMLKGMVYRLSGYVLAVEVEKRTKNVVFTVEVPSNWWQHFKLDIFPQWLLSKLPVEYKTISETRKIIFRKLATYPKANLVIPKEFGDIKIYRSFIKETSNCYEVREMGGWGYRGEYK